MSGQSSILDGDGSIPFGSLSKPTLGPMIIRCFSTQKLRAKVEEVVFVRRSSKFSCSQLQAGGGGGVDTHLYVIIYSFQHIVASSLLLF